MVGNEGPNYIPPLAMTLGHHASAIIYFGKVIRELGPGNCCVGVEAHGAKEMRMLKGEMLFLHLPPPHWGQHRQR